MVSLGAKANLKTPNPKAGQKAGAAGFLSGSGFSHSNGCRHPLSSDCKKSLADRGFVKPVGKKRLPVIYWVARYWVQPIGKA